ncbi:MAG TPA: DUF3859 domain-containing protein [Pirellulaceae bacterium]|nr:DUF3859 domain-containing protein [Pirellulaceae bacterium]
MSHPFRIVLFSVLAMAPVAAVAQEERPTAKIVEYGRYKADWESLAPAPNISGGVEVRTGKPRHKETTKVIPARVGENFGFRVEFQNLPKNRKLVVKDVMSHPEILQPDGKIIKEAVRETTLRFDKKKRPDATYLWSFLEGYEYELVPGKWTRTIYIDGREVASMSFDVVWPEE